MRLDRLDRLLLNLVQRDSARTAEELSDQTPLSPSSVQRRLKQLRKHGVIVSETAVVDPKKVGKPTFFIVSLEVERERPELLARLRSWLLEQDEIQQVFYVTGPADFVLVLTAQDTDSYDALMSRLVLDNPNVRRFTTNVALGVLKRSLMIPVPLSDSE